MAINMKEDSMMYSQNYDSKNVERIITTRSDSKYIDPRFKRILLSLILGTRGGIISYGATYFLRPIMENHYRVFSEIVTKIGNDQIENLPKKRPS
jgi:hypothetical protein